MAGPKPNAAGNFASPKSAKEGKMLRWRRCPRRPFLRVVFFVVLPLLFVRQAVAQLEELAEFKGVNIPFSFKHEDRVVEKGSCDFILMRNMPNTFMLNIKKRGKSLLLISGGEKIDYMMQGNAVALEKDPDIPKNAKLSIKRVPGENVLYVIIETGKRARSCPFHKIRFRLEYLE
jgi:hypothetical protein